MATLPNQIMFAQVLRVRFAKGEAKNQMKTTKMLFNSPLSFLLFVYFLVLPHLYISLFSSLSPEISINSFSFHLIVIKRSGSSAVVDFQVASHFQLIKLKHKILNLVRRSRCFLQSPRKVSIYWYCNFQ